MKRKFVLAILLAVVMQPLSLYAATAKCRVVKSQGNQLVLECSQVVGKISQGDTVKVKTEGKN